jgi:hypothetical protein
MDWMLPNYSEKNDFIHIILTTYEWVILLDSLGSKCFVKTKEARMPHENSVCRAAPLHFSLL